ncbi:MAG: hypothetical protein PUQ00_12510 [Nostoc sp. S13]|nr:hypothetical protein [Nostoc sp. S13]
MYHNQLICLAAIAKKYLSLQKFTKERLTVLAESVAVRILQLIPRHFTPEKWK